MFSYVPPSAVIVLAGVAGSGKSSWARQHFKETEILSSDKLRAALTDDEEHRDCSSDAFDILRTLLELRLKYRRRCVIDATNLHIKARRPYLELARAYNVPSMLVWFDVPEQVCIRRQNTRARKVPVHAIRRQTEIAADMQEQIRNEGWDAIGRVSWLPPNQGGDQIFERIRAWTPPRVSPDGPHSVRVTAPALDIIGDVHGCRQELDTLLDKLGWRCSPEGQWHHPEPRMVVFVGDLTDRGPNSVGVLELAIAMVQQDQALLVCGNHDDKLKRWLMGRNVSLEHGLGTTAAEFEALDPERRARLVEESLTLLTQAPWWASCELPNGISGTPPLVIAHAAWSHRVPRWPAKRAKAFCLFGPTTGHTSNLGLPQRLDWRVTYSKHAPLCVFGHNPHCGPVRPFRNTLAIDTACVFGNKLTAWRWPSGDIVQVDALAEYAPSRSMLTRSPAYTLPEDDLDEEQMDDTIIEADPLGPEKPFNLRIDHLLDLLHSDQEAVLEQIHTDPLLQARSAVSPLGTTLCLANASKDLFTPQAEHHLFAKGLVYTEAPWKLLSVPYLKIYNLGERDDTRELTLELASRDGVQVRFNTKLDGSLIQSFAAPKSDGTTQVVLTTRNMFEWPMAGQNNPGFDYLGTARAILERQTPKALDSALVEGLTLLWELIHPSARIVTDYGEQEAVILTGVVDLRDGSPRYLPRHELETLATQLEAPVTDEYMLPGDTVMKRIEALEQKLAETDLEGAVLTLEGPDLHGRPAVLHRVKVKGAHYLKLMRQMTRCTYDRTREIINLNPGLLSWDDLRLHLISLGSSEVPEEVLSAYKAHYNTWQQYQNSLQELADEADRAFGVYLADVGPPTPRSEDPKAYGQWRKTFATWNRQHLGDSAWLLFLAADQKLTPDQIDRRFSGDKDEVQEAKASLIAMAATLA